ncbi:hypothetical protein U4X67_23945 [Escherichia coli]|nr:hypothetical protein [Escherichia coli]MEB6505958.1 hypothetical protein [Escherichia coli]
MTIGVFFGKNHLKSIGYTWQSSLSSCPVFLKTGQLLKLDCHCIILFFLQNVNTGVDFITLSVFVVVSDGFMSYIQR